MSALADDGAVGGYAPSFVDVDGIDTRYYHVGSGPTVVLIHGGVWGGSASANSWAGAFDALADRFEVYAFDRIGCGLTDAPDDLDDLDVDRVVAHTLGCFDAFDIDAAHVFGSSFGAGIASFVALESSERVRSLVLTNSGTIAPPTGDATHRRSLFERGLPEPDGSLKRERERVRHRFGTFYYDADHIDDAFVDTVARMGQTETSERLMAAMTGAWGQTFQVDLGESMHDLHGALLSGELTKPTCIVWGRNDPTTPVAAARGLFDLFGQHSSPVELSILHEAGHLPYNEHPAVFGDLAEGFVKRNG